MSWRRHENHIARLERCGATYKIIRIEDNGAWVNSKWPGAKGWSKPAYWRNPTTVINTCAVCERIGAPKRIHERSGIYGWNLNGPDDYTAESKSMLCMGCWNRVRRLVAMEREAALTRSLVNKLKKEIAKCQKSQLQAN